MARRRLVRLLGDESGNAAIEAALVIPVVLVLAFGVVGVGRVVQAQIALQSVVREASRTVAVAPSASQGTTTAEARALEIADGHGLAPDRLDLAIDAGAFERGGIVRAEAIYRVSLSDLPLLGLIEVAVSADSEQRVEQYRSRAAVRP